MCVLLRESALPLLAGLRRAKNFDTPITLPNLWLLKRLLFLAFLKNRTEAEIPPNSGFWKSRFFHWGARLSFFSWFDRIFSFILLNVNLWCLKNLAITNFLAFCIFIESPWVFVNLCTWKQAKFWVLDFPKICSNFAYVWGFVLGFVSFARFTEKRFLKAHTSTVEFSSRLQLNLAI